MTIGGNARWIRHEGQTICQSPQVTMPDDTDVERLLEQVAVTVEHDPVQATLLLSGVPAERVDGRVRALAARAALLRGDDTSCIDLAHAALADPTLPSRSRAIAAASLGGAVLYSMENVATATEVLEQTIRRIDPSDVELVAGRLAQIYSMGLDLPALEHLLETVPPRLRSPACELRMVSCHALLLAHAGRTTEALERSRPLPAIATAAGDAAAIEGVEAAYFAATLRVLAGKHASALRLADGLAALDPRLVPFAAMLRGEVALERGDLPTAAMALAASIGTRAPAPGEYRAYIASCLLCAAHGLMGDRDAAEVALSAVPTNLRGELPVLAGHFTRVQAIITACDGGAAAAVRELSQHAVWAMARRMDVEALRSLHLAIRLGAPWNQVAVVERLRVDGRVDDAMLGHAMAWGGQHLDALQASAERFAELDLRLLAAEAWGHVAIVAERSGCAALAIEATARSRAGIEACHAFGPTTCWLPGAPAR